MDNNTAERSERGPVVGRKNYYGSGSLGSGRLAAMLFSLFQTLALWGINPRAWLTAYLTACAEAGGQAPARPEALLPWHLSDLSFGLFQDPETPENRGFLVYLGLLGLRGSSGTARKQPESTKLGPRKSESLVGGHAKRAEVELRHFAPSSTSE